MAYLSDDELLDTEGGFTGWDDGTGAGAEETLEQALAEERLAELESELEQDEHPIDYEAELEDRGRRSRPGQRKAAETGDAGRGHTAAGGSRTHRKGFPGRGGGMEQAGPEPGAPGTGPRKPPWGCAAGISGGAGTEAHSPLDEQPRIPAADGRELSGHPV